MDEILDVADVVLDLGFGNLFAWLLRIAGLVLLGAGLYLWLGTEAGLLVVPAVLVGVGVVLLVAPSVFLLFVEGV